MGFLRSFQISMLTAVLVVPFLSVRSAQAQNSVCYEVADPDGWVNVRDIRSREVVAQVNNGTRFWSRDRTRDGLVVLGFPHDSMVVSINRLKLVPSGSGCDSYVTYDRDGASNLRREPNGEVMDQVASGTTVIVTGRSGEWWQVLTEDRRMGFLHRSRLR